MLYFGRLCASREIAGLSQRELAARLGVAHSWVAKVENGERRVDLLEFSWFVSACGVDPIVESARLLGQIRDGARPADKRGRKK